MNTHTALITIDAQYGFMPEEGVPVVNRFAARFQDMVFTQDGCGMQAAGVHRVQSYSL